MDFASRHGFTLLPLHGDLPAAEQDRAVRPGRGRKLILSTNVAESSVTIPGVVAVIDSGLARLPVHSPWSGLPSLQTARVSQASATQRAGRAGRTQPGRALRLYTRADFEARPLHETPEIARADLSDMVLALAASGVTDRRHFPFFQAPPAAALEAAERLLLDLRALAPSGGLTELGHRMLAFPLHPRLARVVAEGERRGVGRAAATAAALLAERDVRRSARTRLDGPRGRARATTSARSDVLERLADVSAGEAARRELDPAALAAVERASRQLVPLVHKKAVPPATEEAREDALLLSLLTGFPDRVAKRRRPHAPELLLSSGGSATLDEGSAVQEPTLLLALDAEVRTSPRGPETRVRVASEVQEDWLLELFPERLRDVEALEWNVAQARVDRVGQLLYGELLLDESRKPAVPSAEASRVLAEHLQATGLRGLLDAETLEAWSARLAFLAEAYPEADIPRPLPNPRAELPALLAEGRTSLQRAGRRDGATGVGRAFVPKASGAAQPRPPVPRESAGRKEPRRPLPAGCSSVRGLKASGLFRPARGAAHLRGPCSVGAAASRSQPAAGASHHGLGWLLGASLPRAPPRAGPALPPACLAARPGARQSAGRGHQGPPVTRSCHARRTALSLSTPNVTCGFGSLCPGASS